MKHLQLHCLAGMTFVCLLSTAVAAGASPLPVCPDYVPGKPGGDYNDPTDREGLTVVEQFHFTPPVESLVKGVSGPLGGDIGYTLDHFPNHHRALAAMMKLALREKNRKPPGARYTIDCYFERATRFRPNDARVRTLHGSYLLAIGRQDDALEQLEKAAVLEPANPAVHYNLGLLYLQKQQYDKARASAHQAYKMGFPLPGLKNKLVAAGQWKEAN